MTRKSELAELRERIAALEAQLAPKTQEDPVEPTTAEVMLEMFGMTTDESGKVIATPEEIAAHAAREKEKADVAAQAIAYARKWERENGFGFGGPSSSPADIARVLEGQRGEHHAWLVAEGLARDIPGDAADRD